jgi:hypothetical protein
MYYIYKTTNIINDKIYIGLHKSDDINNDNYIGSGQAFLKSVKKHGKVNFKREILFEFETFDDALTKESILVNTEFVRRRDTYNLTTGGKGMDHISGHNVDKICIYSPRTNKNHYIELEKLNDFIEDGWLLGNNSKGRICIKKDNEIKYTNIDELDVYLLNGWEKSNTTQDKICITNIKTNKLKYINKEDINIYLDNGYLIGNKKSGINKGTIYINKEQKNKRINHNDLDSYIKLGWTKGFFQVKVKSKRMFNPSNNELKNIPIDKLSEYENNGWIFGHFYSNKNRIYVSKDTKNRLINIEDLDEYILNGWKKGMYNKRYNNKI